MTAGTVANKVVRWHRMPFTQFVVHESKRPLFRPFLYGAAFTWVVCGILPTRGATEEDKMKSNYWKRTHGKFDYSHH